MDEETRIIRPPREEDLPAPREEKAQPEAEDVSAAAHEAESTPTQAETEAKSESIAADESEAPPPVEEKKSDSADEAPAPEGKPPALTNEKVTEHTASLWKYLPVPADEPEPYPEYLSCSVRFPGSFVTGARVRGKKHKHEGSNCDDWFEAACCEQITFIVASDGAGSKKYSRIGARESCKASIGYLVKSFEDLLQDSPEIRENIKLPLTENACIESCRAMALLVQQSVVKAYEAVEAAYYSRSTDEVYSRPMGRKITFKDFSGTFLIAVIVPVKTETKEHLVISCQIGDGMICVLNTKGEFSSSLRLLGVPDSGDFSGETDFLTSPQMKTMDALQKRTKLYRGVVDTVMVMTDGVADDYFPNETEMRRLYCDLVVNGVITGDRGEVDLSSVPKEDLRLFKKLPDPLTYPWVNDQNVKVTLQYTKRIQEATGLSLEEIWNDQKILDLARAEISEFEKTEDPGERLKVWLDNYVERGSFDDRTLVIARM